MLKKFQLLTLICVLVMAGVLLSACGTGNLQTGEKIILTSPSFTEGEIIPIEFTGKTGGSNLSPELQWNSAPVGTQSFALICDDPDAPGATWVHWVIYNIPADARSLSQGLPKDAELPDGVKQGQNSWSSTDHNNIGYDGPQPPSGTHRYFFKLYALDAKLQLEGDVTKEVLEDAMAGHVLGWGQLMGKCSAE